MSSIALEIAPDRQRTHRPYVASSRSSPSQVRLTRRGRLVVFLASLALVLAAFVAFGAGSVATGESGEAPVTEIVKVTPGQTLWGIASERAEHGGEVRQVMQQIERLNALESGMLSVGQKLRVPVAE